MMGLIANLFLNLLVVALLAVTICYCYVLNRRIRVLQDGKSELAELLEHFDQSTTRAAESIMALQTASKKIGDTIQLRTDKANYVLDDLSFMVEKASHLVDQLEANAAVDRARVRAMAEAPAIKPPPVAEQPAPAPKKQTNAKEKKEKTAAAMELLLERVLKKKPVSEAETPPKKEDAPMVSRSRAEQELLEMIRAGMKG